MLRSEDGPDGRPDRSLGAEEQRTPGPRLQAFGDPLRQHIVRRLAADGEAGCGDIELPVTRATGSYHFRVLRQAGWTPTRRIGRERYISLRRDDLEARFPGLLAALLKAAETEAANT
ncbi:ArsR/SmtB family transcription factor [Streptomyces paromomycinus]|uniref:Transcriptional regulator n=1 Tax=Streptomyces paromomycinus TaxID=92743 RepID=A0A401WBL3_STREY|nr:transcriptional regulator [Streptomyces paromomycinus]GCD46734.1 transcriptional regulator [Streptomyces paromomycinus]